jgi:predicted Zn-dependent peptidase
MGLERGERFEEPVEEIKGHKPVLIQRKSAKNLTFCFTFMLRRRLTEEEFDAIECLNYILNGTFHSRIFGEARKRGLVYGISSNVDNWEKYSEWMFDGEVTYAKAGELFALLGRELKRIARGDLSDSEVEAAKLYALGRFQMDAQTPEQVNNYYAGSYFTFGDVLDFEAIPKKIRNLNKEKILEVAREFLASDVATLCGVARGEKVDLEKLWKEIRDET